MDKVCFVHDRNFSIEDVDGTLVRPGVKFWGYFCSVPKRIPKPRIFIPHSFVNVQNSSQFWLWTNMRTGKVMVRPDANYQEFEKTLEKKMKLEKLRGADVSEQRSLEIDHKRKSHHFVAARICENDYETETVRGREYRGLIC